MALVSLDQLRSWLLRRFVGVLITFKILTVTLANSCKQVMVNLLLINHSVNQKSHVPHQKVNKSLYYFYSCSNNPRWLVCLFFPSCRLAGCQWNDPGHGFLPDHVHLPLNVGDERGLFVPFHRTLSPRRWRQPHHLWWFQRGVLLAQTQHTWGQGCTIPHSVLNTSYTLFFTSSAVMITFHTIVKSWRRILFWRPLPASKCHFSSLLQDAKVMSWWDYGYQITAMANRTILVDNNTWNNTHISRVGQVNTTSPTLVLLSVIIIYIYIYYCGIIVCLGNGVLRGESLWDHARVGCQLRLGDLWRTDWIFIRWCVILRMSQSSYKTN